MIELQFCIRFKLYIQNGIDKNGLKFSCRFLKKNNHPNFELSSAVFCQGVQNYVSQFFLQSDFRPTKNGFARCIDNNEWRVTLILITRKGFFNLRLPLKKALGPKQFDTKSGLREEIFMGIRWRRYTTNEYRNAAAHSALTSEKKCNLEKSHSLHKKG